MTMIQGKEMKNYYKAEEGYTIIRISDNFNMGEWIFLGTNDSIDNYESIPIQSYQAKSQESQKIEVENFNNIDEIIVDDMTD